MLKPEDRGLIHQHLVLDLTLKSLERDLKHLDNLKTQHALANLYKTLITEVKTDLKQVNIQIYKNGIKIYDSVKIDEYFINYKVTKQKREHEQGLTYSVDALRMWVNQEVNKRITK